VLVRRASTDAFKEADFQVPVIASRGVQAHTTLGNAGEKEGPYDWVPPLLVDSSHFDPADDSRTNAGGSWGFASEQKRRAHRAHTGLDQTLLSPVEQRSCGRSDYNQYHAKLRTQVGGYAFARCHVGHGDHTALRAMELAGVLRPSSRRSRTTRHRRSSNPSCTTRRIRQPVDPCRLLAAQQGLGRTLLCRCTTTTAIRQARTSAPRRPTSPARDLCVTTTGR